MPTHVTHLQSLFTQPLFTQPLFTEHWPQGFAAHKVHVQVIDLLSAMFVAIDEQPVAVLVDACFFGKFGGYGKQSAEHLFVFFGDVVGGRDEFVGDNQYMRGCLRADVAKCGY